ncbi:MAG: nucleoside monophosphate kinase [Candidatus Melainabacteria bacterium]|nr:nucleoside monophosphate kinase [Candidatus Melainabacteria bacterium]
MTKKILFLGPAGSGKGTQSAKLAEKFGIEHLSTGDLIRGEIKSGSELGNKVKSIVEAGQLVSDDIVNEIVKAKVANLDAFILDGYPRTKGQAEFFSTVSDLDFIFDLEVDSEALIERLTGRRMCGKENDKNCKGTFHTKFNPPQAEGKCDLCGSPLYQRKDDTEEAINKRLGGYEAETGAPLNEFYGAKVSKVNANRKPDEVFADIESKLQVSV